MSDYSYLKSQKIRSRDGVMCLSNNNFFRPVIERDIITAEAQLGFSLPEPLKDFYRQIGYGYLTTPYNAADDYDFSSSNVILPPTAVANFYRRIPLWEHQEFYISQEALDILEPGDMPFFEIGDSCRFLIMRPLSDSPETIRTTSGIKIEDSFERFIWRLYYESPWFYDDIITKYYEHEK